MDVRRYLRLLVFLASLEVTLIALFGSSLFFHRDDQMHWREEAHSIAYLLQEFGAPTKSSETVGEESSIHTAGNMLPETKSDMDSIRKSQTPLEGIRGLSGISSGSKEIISRLSPPDMAAAEGIQVDEETMILVGGYIDEYKSVSRWIQVFNITSQEWLTADRIRLPDHLAETHQGIAFDKETDTLYIVSGQKGPGCMPGTTAAGRVHLKTGKFDALPDLPQPRYAPGMELVSDPQNPTIRHLHLFGGAGHARNQTATDHWRLKIADDLLDGTNLAWEVLEAVPDAGTHGVSFLYSGYIYYTGFCTLDPGTVAVPSMAECHVHAAMHSRQILHHVSDAGLAYRYRTAFASPRGGQSMGLGWERLEDMPFPVCHSGSLSVGDKLYVIGGGVATRQTMRGSAPSSFAIVQTYDATSNTWSVASFDAPKRFHLFLMATWLDRTREKLYSLHSGRSLVIGDIAVDNSTAKVKSLNESDFYDLQLSFMSHTRELTVYAFQQCMKSEMGVDRMVMQTLFDNGYDDVRGTWNLRTNHLQYPDVVVFPETVQQVPWIVQCSKRTGYHICGRNGRHSYDGSTCTHGIVVDVTKLDSVTIVNFDEGVVRLGGGLTLGRVAVELERDGMSLPMGSCSSVGVTGLTLNGGQGPLSRMHGLTSDLLESVELVDSSGQIINATVANTYSDYFWLARGCGSVGHHFPGIITGLQFRGLPKVPRNSTIWTRVKLSYRPTVNNAIKLLTAWQEFFAASNPHDPFLKRITAEPWLFMRFRRRKKIHEPALYMVIYFFGNEELHETFMERYLQLFEGMGGGVKARSLERLDELAFHRVMGGVKTTEELANSAAGHDLKTVWEGFSAVAHKPVPERALRQVAETIFLQQPFYRRYAEFKPLGGAIQDFDRKDTAFWHRSAAWWVLVNHFYGQGEEDGNEVGRQSIHRHAQLIEAMGASFGGEYAGYVHHSNSTSLDLNRYCGNNSERVQLIKRARDPHNIFRHYLPSRPRTIPRHGTNTRPK